MRVNSSVQMLYLVRLCCLVLPYIFFTFVSLHVPFLFQCLTLNVSQGSNTIGDDGARAIADAMRVNSSVQTLQLVRLCCLVLLDVFFTFVSLLFH